MYFFVKKQLFKEVVKGSVLNHLCRSFYPNKVVANSLKRRPQHKCLLVNFVKVFRTNSLPERIRTTTSVAFYQVERLIK